MQPFNLFVKVLISVLFITSFTNSLFAQKDTALFEKIENSSMYMYDFKVIRNTGWDTLYRIPEHPAFDIMLTKAVEDSLLAEINYRKEIIGDTLRTADLFYIWKPYFEWLRDIDPHYNVNCVVPPAVPYNEIKDNAKLQEQYGKQQSNALATVATVLPIHAININDTLVVTVSNTPDIVSGDMILAINGTTVGEIMKYNFNYRYIHLYLSLLNYYYHGFDKEYIVELVRDGKKITVKTDGYKEAHWQRNYLMDKEEQPLTQYFENAKTGYIRIPQFFPNNSRVINDFRKNILKYKKLGCENIIVDLRNNPGGSGSGFDKLLAIFIDKPEIPIARGEKLKISDQTENDYEFITEEMMGKLIDLPDGSFYKSFPLNQKYHISGVKYYVLMDQGTESTAALLCNVLQYNGGATLVGEPLLKNSFKYGEILDTRSNPYIFDLMRDECISTTESDLYTKAVDGILMPDIHIPYIAKEYMTGKDMILEKLINRCYLSPGR